MLLQDGLFLEQCNDVERNPGPFQKGFGRPSLGSSSTKQKTSPEKAPDKTDIAPQVTITLMYHDTAENLPRNR